MHVCSVAWGHETSFYRFCQIVPEVGMTQKNANNEDHSGSMKSGSTHSLRFTPCGVKFLMFLTMK